LSTAAAQNITGIITGVVEDQSGGRLANASVTAVNRDTGIRYTATTTEAGIYVMPQLPLIYTLSVEAQGFKTFVMETVPLNADERLRVDARLELGGTAVKVTVSDVPPRVESERATIGGAFTREQFDSLPIGRDPWPLWRWCRGRRHRSTGFRQGYLTAVTRRRPITR